MKGEPITTRLSEESQKKIDEILKASPWLNRSSVIDKAIMGYFDLGSMSLYDMQQHYRRMIYERDKRTCQICHQPLEFSDMHLDHKIPKCEGGSDIANNLQATHSLCNSKKGPFNSRGFKKTPRMSKKETIEVRFPEITDQQLSALVQSSGASSETEYLTNLIAVEYGRKEPKMNTNILYDRVARLIETPTIKDGTYLTDWIAEGDTDGMTPEEIAAEWDALPGEETDY